MNFNHLLEMETIDPAKVLVFRHCPKEPKFKTVFPWLAEERHELFNAYQQTHGPREERAMQSIEGSGFVASFIGLKPGFALFVGLYSVGASQPLTYEQYWEMPLNLELKELGHAGFTDRSRSHIRWFDLKLLSFRSNWKGKLVVKWPPPERSWYRRAQNNDLAIESIHEESLLQQQMLSWDSLVLSWDQLNLIPKSWKSKMTQWRGVYLIHDSTDGKCYIGSAYGEDNIMGRWKNYAATGHGSNKYLRMRKPNSFSFSILQRVSPDMGKDDVIQIEQSWKRRLHTQHPEGLNDN